MAEGAEHVVEHCGDGCLAVGACYAHQLEFGGGVAVELCGHFAHSIFGVGHLHVRHTIGGIGWYGFAYQHCRSTLLYGFGYVKVTVSLRALYGYEQVAGYHFSRVYINTCYFTLQIALCGYNCYFFQCV